MQLKTRCCFPRTAKSVTDTYAAWCVILHGGGRDDPYMTYRTPHHRFNYFGKGASMCEYVSRGNHFALPRVSYKLIQTSSRPCVMSIVHYVTPITRSLYLSYVLLALPWCCFPVTLIRQLGEALRTRILHKGSTSIESPSTDFSSRLKSKRRAYWTVRR